MVENPKLNLEPMREDNDRQEMPKTGEGKSFFVDSAGGRATERELAAIRTALGAPKAGETVFVAQPAAGPEGGIISSEAGRPTTKKKHGREGLINKLRALIGLGAVMGALGNEAKAEGVAPINVGSQPSEGPKVVILTAEAPSPEVYKYNQKIWTPRTPEEKMAAERAAEKLRTGESFWGGNPGTLPSSESAPVNPPSAPEHNEKRQSQPPANNGGVVYGGEVGPGPTVYGGYVPGGRVNRRGISHGGDRYYSPVSQDGYAKEYNAGGPRQARRSAFMHEKAKDSGNKVITDGNEIFKNPFKGEFFKPYGNRGRK